MDKAEKSKERILNAAAGLFREQGYAAVSLRMIAAAADMKAGSVYYHFESKEQIVVDVLNIGIEKVQESVESALDALGEGASAKMLLSTCITAHLTALHRFSDYTSANVRIYGQVPEEAQHGNLYVRRQYELLWERIFALPVIAPTLRRPAETKAMRLMLIGSLNATLEWFNPDNQTIESLAETYADLLLGGFLTEREMRP